MLLSAINVYYLEIYFKIFLFQTFQDSSSKSETLQQTCSNAISGDSITSSDLNGCFSRPAKPTVSFSDGCSVGDYPECEEFSMVMTEEHPCIIPCIESQLPSAWRDGAVLRYKEKRKARK